MLQTAFVSGFFWQTDRNLSRGFHQRGTSPPPQPICQLRRHLFWATISRRHLPPPTSSSAVVTTRKSNLQPHQLPLLHKQPRALQYVTRSLAKPVSLFRQTFIFCSFPYLSLAIPCTPFDYLDISRRRFFRHVKSTPDKAVIWPALPPLLNNFLETHRPIVALAHHRARGRTNKKEKEKIKEKKLSAIRSPPRLHLSHAPQYNIFALLEKVIPSPTDFSSLRFIFKFTLASLADRL